jgi:hypothetical protein
MDLYQKIMASYPDLPQNVFWKRIIILRNDSDGEGDYIEQWNYSKPIPDGLTLGKPLGGN